MKRLSMSDELPKGMAPSMPIEHSAKAPEVPAPLTLAGGNYAGAIRQALDILPVRIRVDRCLVLERHGRAPEVALRLTVLGEKEDADGTQQDRDPDQRPDAD